MHESIALTMEAILSPDDYTSLYADTSDDSDEAEVENFNWDSETRTKAQGLLRTTQTPVHAISFITVMFTVYIRTCKAFDRQTLATKSRYLQSLQTC